MFGLQDPHLIVRLAELNGIVKRGGVESTRGLDKCYGPFLSFPGIGTATRRLSEIRRVIVGFCPNPRRRPYLSTQITRGVVYVTMPRFEGLFFCSTVAQTGTMKVRDGTQRDYSLVVFHHIIGTNSFVCN